jgi:ferredoxin
VSAAHHSMRSSLGRARRAVTPPHPEGCALGGSGKSWVIVLVRSAEDAKASFCNALLTVYRGLGIGGKSIVSCGEMVGCGECRLRIVGGRSSVAIPGKNVGKARAPVRCLKSTRLRVLPVLGGDPTRAFGLWSRVVAPAVMLY